VLPKRQDPTLERRCRTVESNSIVKPSWRSEYACALAPTAGTFQGIALPMFGLKRRLRFAASGTDHDHRTS
jgi:hypothetical protein